MSSADLHVTCPQCGSKIAAPTEPNPSPSDRLKGALGSCSDCENGFELYYY
jgi:hypothetical protein